MPFVSQNRIDLTFVIDTNFVGDDSSAASDLLRFHTDGLVRLVRTDTVETELNEAPDAKYQGLLDEVEELSEDYGVMRLDHSRLDRSVLGSEEDGERFERLFSVLKPGVERTDPSRQHLRDVMHIDTAIRYARDGFITRDKGLLSKADVAVAEFGIRILTPEEAVETIKER